MTKDTGIGRGNYIRKAKSVNCYTCSTKFDTCSHSVKINCPNCRKLLQNKRCNKWGKEHKEQMKEYYKEYNKSDRGKELKKINAKKNYSKYAERRKAYARQYWKDNKELYNAKLYNITLEEYKTITTKCLVCGFTELVDLHHKDNNHKNTKLSNLIGLCPNHHFLIHRKHKTLEELLK